MRFLRILLFLPLFFGGVRAASAASPARSRLQTDFRDAAREFDVPESILLSVSYHLTLWESHAGQPSTSGGYGPMELTQVPGSHIAALHTLDRAARLLRLAPSVLKTDPRENIRGGAALLALDARELGIRPRSVADWYGAVVRLAGTDSGMALHFADTVYDTIRTGEARRLSDGEPVRLTAQAVLPNRSSARWSHLVGATTPRADCPAALHCRFVPAAYQVVDPNNPEDYGNYDVANRKKMGIQYRYIIIHDTEGSYNGAITTFQDPSRYASANYVIRSSDGQITQMVPNRDIAWHAGNYYVNMHSIGIEHEGIAVQGATWYGEQLYESSAALVAYLAAKFHIPLDRAHILGHEEVPGPTPQTQAAQHWDPGPFWNWSRYMDLLQASLTPSDNARSKLVTIDPTFESNEPPVSSCAGCAALPGQPANFVYLRSAPSAAAPLLGDNALGPVGTTRASDWGDKAVTGARYLVVGRHGDWVAIDFGGKTAWLENPVAAPVLLPSDGRYITPKPGMASIPVYGDAYPEASAYPADVPPSRRPKFTPLQYTISSGQKYVMVDKVGSDYYWSPTMTTHVFVQGKTSFYQIFFNHRFAFVRARDVTVKTVSSSPTPTPSPTGTVVPTPTSTPTPTASPGQR